MAVEPRSHGNEAVPSQKTLCFSEHICRSFRKSGKYNTHLTDEKLRLREVRWLLQVRMEAGGKAKSEPVFGS